MRGVFCTPHFFMDYTDYVAMAYPDYMWIMRIICGLYRLYPWKKNIIHTTYALVLYGLYWIILIICRWFDNHTIHIIKIIHIIHTNDLLSSLKCLYLQSCPRTSRSLKTTPAFRYPQKMLEYKNILHLHQADSVLFHTFCQCLCHKWSGTWQQF